METLFIVVAIYTPVVGNTLIHAYGPYTKDQASSRRRAILRWAPGEGTLDVRTTKLLDPENISPFVWTRHTVDDESTIDLETES